MKFEILSGPEDGKIKEIPGNEVRMGRKSEGSDLSFPYARMLSGGSSYCHARVFKSGDSYYVVDVGKGGRGSTNGSSVLRKTGPVIEIGNAKDSDYQPGDKIPIEPGDVIILGKSIWIKFLGE